MFRVFSEVEAGTEGVMPVLSSSLHGAVRSGLWAVVEVVVGVLGAPGRVKKEHGLLITR